jgi:hypothetical protein
VLAFNHVNYVLLLGDLFLLDVEDVGVVTELANPQTLMWLELELLFDLLGLKLRL